MEQQLNPEIENYIDNLNKQLDSERVRRMNIETQFGKNSLISEGAVKDQNVIDKQLNLKEIKEEIFHLLSGHQIKVNNSNGEEYYAEPEDDRLKTFSKYGIDRIMGILSFYLNINHLMAFYDEETIKWKVRDFGIELSDLFNNLSELLLHYPSPEELYEKYLPIVKEQRLEITNEELYEKCILWSEDELHSKENLIPMFCWAIINIVHSVYTRAFQGKERTSLGERGINISQNNSGAEYLPQSPQKSGGMFSWMKG